MRTHFLSGLVAGVTAAVIWLACAMIAGMTASTIGIVALIMLVVTTAITMAISNSVGARRVGGA